jgi:hypothetical protein
MPFGLDQLGGLGHDSPEDAFQIPENAPVSVRRLPAQFDRLVREGDVDQAERSLRNLPTMLANPPVGTTTETLVGLIEYGARAFATIAVEKSTGRTALNRGGASSLIPLVMTRQQLLEPARRHVDGAVEASCVIAGVEAEALISIARISLGSDETQRDGVHRAVRVIADLYQYLHRPFFEDVIGDGRELDRAMTLPVARVVDTALDTPNTRALDDLIAALVVDPTIQGNLRAPDHLQLVSVFAGALGRRVVAEIADAETTDVADVLSTESQLRASAGRVYAQLGSNPAVAQRIDHLVGRASTTITDALKAELAHLRSPECQVLNPRPMYIGIASYAFQSRLVCSADRPDDIFRDAIIGLVEFSAGRAVSLARLIDNVFDDGLILPEATTRMAGDVVQVDRITPTSVLGRYVREGLWNELARAQLTGRLQEPESESGWRRLWRDLTWLDGESDLYATLGVDTPDKEVALGEARLRSQFALTVTSLTGELRQSLDAREFLLVLWAQELIAVKPQDEAEDYRSDREILVSNAARSLTETLVRIGQRVSVDTTLSSLLSKVNVFSMFGNLTPEDDLEETLAELSAVTIANVITIQKFASGYVPQSLSESLTVLCNRYGLSPEVGTATRGVGLFSDLTPRPEDSSY